jgi:hypothetical protein
MASLREVSALRALACAVPVIRWGAKTSSDKLRQCARCTASRPQGRNDQASGMGGASILASCSRFELVPTAIPPFHAASLSAPTGTSPITNPRRRPAIRRRSLASASARHSLKESDQIASWEDDRKHQARRLAAAHCHEEGRRPPKHRQRPGESQLALTYYLATRRYQGARGGYLSVQTFHSWRSVRRAHGICVHVRGTSSRAECAAPSRLLSVARARYDEWVVGPLIKADGQASDEGASFLPETGVVVGEETILRTRRRRYQP